jgi:hypothetical protein
MKVKRGEKGEETEKETVIDNVGKRESRLH